MLIDIFSLGSELGEYSLDAIVPDISESVDYLAAVVFEDIPDMLNAWCSVLVSYE